jgi:hypothetical protein
MLHNNNSEYKKECFCYGGLDKFKKLCDTCFGLLTVQDKGSGHIL